MVAIIDYGVGNLFSLQSSLKSLNFESKVTSKKDEILAASHTILPGVGAFGDAIAKLRYSELDKIILDVAKHGKPLLGICLGMQLLYQKSHEFGSHDGLSLLNGEVLPLKEKTKLTIPHMGWNSLIYSSESKLLKSVKNNDFVYFVHSFYVPENEHTIANTEYGNIKITALSANNNVFGAQFHPEKSGKVGLSILKSFCEV